MTPLCDDGTAEHVISKRDGRNDLVIRVLFMVMGNESRVIEGGVEGPADEPLEIFSVCRRRPYPTAIFKEGLGLGGEFNLFAAQKDEAFDVGFRWGIDPVMDRPHLRIAP